MIGRKRWCKALRPGKRLRSGIAETAGTTDALRRKTRRREIDDIERDLVNDEVEVVGKSWQPLQQSEVTT